MGIELSHADGQTDGRTEKTDRQTDRQTDMTKLIIFFFCNFSNAPKILISERRHAFYLSRLKPESPRLWNRTADC